MSFPADNSVLDTQFSGGRKFGRMPEKSNFAQTCNLLSQYLKEKRTLGVGISPVMESNSKEDFQTSRPPTMMNFLTNMENPEEHSKDKTAAVSVETEPPSAAQMTIFYGGKVLVFNDLPSNRAEEIMAMAGKGISSFRSDMIIEPIVGNQQPQSKISGDMPIARRTSLHRFFEKRKDRVAAKAPYQVNPHSVSSKAGESSYKFNNNEEMGNYYNQSSKKFDLNL